MSALDKYIGKLNEAFFSVQETDHANLSFVRSALQFTKGRNHFIFGGYVQESQPRISLYISEGNALLGFAVLNDLIEDKLHTNGNYAYDFYLQVTLAGDVPLREQARIFLQAIYEATILGLDYVLEDPKQRTTHPDSYLEEQKPFLHPGLVEEILSAADPYLEAALQETARLRA